MTGREGFVFGTLMAAAVALGVYPRPVFEVAEPAVARLVEDLGDAAAAGELADAIPARLAGAGQ